MTVWMNGHWLDAASVSVGDRGFALGDGLFETIRVDRGVALGLERHVARLGRSAELFGLGEPLMDIDLGELIAQGAQIAGLDSAIVRFSVSAGVSRRGLNRASELELTRVLQVSERAPVAEHISLAISTIRRSPSSPAAGFKTLSYADNVLARRQAQAAGADMAMLLDTEGRVSGADCANVFWTVAGQLRTSALDCAVLPGTVRAAIVERLGAREVRVPLEDLVAADSVFVSNAVMGVVPVSHLDGKALGLDRPLLAAMREALAQDRETTIDRRGRK